MNTTTEPIGTGLPVTAHEIQRLRRRRRILMSAGIAAALFVVAGAGAYTIVRQAIDHLDRCGGDGPCPGVDRHSRIDGV